MGLPALPALPQLSPRIITTGGDGGGGGGGGGGVLPPIGGDGGVTAQQDYCRATTGNIFCFVAAGGGADTTHTQADQGYPNIVILPPGSSPGSQVQVQTSAASWQQTAQNWLNSWITQALGPYLVRILFLILGLVCIIGAIYLYKGSNPIVAVPVKAVKRTASAVKQKIAG